MTVDLRESVNARGEVLLKFIEEALEDAGASDSERHEIKGHFAFIRNGAYLWARDSERTNGPVGPLAESSEGL